jgi:integrase
MHYENSTDKQTSEVRSGVAVRRFSVNYSGVAGDTMSKSNTPAATGNASELKKIDPERVLSRFETETEDENAKETARGHMRQAKELLRWLDARGIHLYELDGWTLGEFQDYLRGDKDVTPDCMERRDLKDITRRQYLSNVKVFLEFCSDKELVHENLHEKITLGSIDMDKQRRDRDISPDRMQKILLQLKEYHRASLEHVVMLLLWQGPRSGAIRNLDVKHCHFEGEDLYIELTHRPEQGLTLKNGYKDKKQAERPVTLKQDHAEIIQEYIEYNRKQATDRYGNEPLLTTNNGRIGESLLRHIVYQWTCPAAIGDDCDIHDRRPRRWESDKCRDENPGMASPHSIRKAAITHWCNRKIKPDIVSQRMNVSLDVIRKHYDDPSNEEAAARQRGAIEKL